MIKARPSDKEQILDILTPAFNTNKSVNYVVRQDSRRTDRIRHLMDYSVEVCREWGEVLLSEDRQASALLLYPHTKKSGLRTILLDLKLAVKSVGLANLQKVMSRESKIKAFHPRQPFLYLWFVGVAPEKQGEGIGSRLMAEIIRESEKQELPIYLETSTRENLPFYQKFGFTIYEELDFGFPFYLLKRDHL